jgi:hypothetical protein
MSDIIKDVEYYAKRMKMRGHEILIESMNSFGERMIKIEINGVEVHRGYYPLHPKKK